MGSVLSAIIGVVTIVVSVATFGWAGVVILMFLSPDFKDFMLEQIGNILALFGIEAEDIINTNVSDQLIFQEDDTYDNIITQIALEHQDTQMGIMELITQHTLSARASYNNYYDYAVNTYDAGLPTTNVSAAVVPLSLVTPIIQSTYGFVPTVLSSSVSVPTKLEWYTYELNRLYGYLSWTQRLTYTGLVYEVKTVDYNYTTDMYDIGMFRPGTELTEITVTIIPFDATQDTKRTNTKISRVLVEGTTVLSNVDVDVLVPKGSEEPSYTSSSVAIEYALITISIAAPQAVRHYVVKFYNTDSSMWYYWIYKIGSGNTALDNANTYITNLEMMPIVELRNNLVNVNVDKESVKYKETKQILEYIGMDVDMLINSISENPDIGNISDAYVYFGLDINQSDPIIAKMLYILFDFVFNDPNIHNGSVDSYTATFNEGNFNSALSWKSQTRTVVDGVIGSVGTYYNTTEYGTDAVVRKQETPEQYVEYRMHNIGMTTLVKRDGLYGIVGRSPTNGPLIVPLSRHFIDQLTPIEQLKLFRKSLRLSIYSASITHLDWYETPAFLNLLKIVITVIGIVLAIASFYAGGQAGTAWYVTAGKMLLWIGASMAFVKLLSYIDNPWLKALLIVVAAIVLYQTGTVTDPNALGFMTADALTTAVTQFTEMKMEELQGQMSEYYESVKEVLEKLKDTTESIADYISTEFVAKLSNLDTSTGYVEGPDLTYYKAIDMQHNWDLVKGGIAYKNAFDYDHFYRLGIV